MKVTEKILPSQLKSCRCQRGVLGFVPSGGLANPSSQDTAGTVGIA